MVSLAATEVTGTAPRRGVARSIVAMAMRAPSLHNTQPWRWRVLSEHALELYADHDRQLGGVDPRGRLMTVSLGCALHHAVVAARSVDRAVRVERFPDDGPPDLVARVHLEGPAPAGPQDLQLLGGPGGHAPAARRGLGARGGARGGAGRAPAGRRRAPRGHRGPGAGLTAAGRA